MKVVFSTANYAEACLARDLLEDRGIPAEVSRDMRSSGGAIPLDLTAVLGVWIADEARAEEAQRLLREELG